MSVAQILERLAENAGRRQLARGQVLGEAIAGASAVPAQIIEDRRRQDLVNREQARADAGLALRQNEDTRQTAAEGRTAGDYTQGKEKEQVLRQVIAAGFKADPNVFDDKAAIAAAQQSKYPELVGTVQDIHAKLTKPIVPPLVVPQGGTAFDQTKPRPDGTLPVIATGTPQRGAAGSMAIGNGGVPIPGSQIPFKPDIPNVGTFEDYVIRLYGSTPTPQQLEAARAKWADLGTANNDAAVQLTPEALKLTAHQFAMTGNLPPMGMGRAAASVRTSIINEAAKQYEGLDLPTQIAAYNSNKKSLSEITPKLDMLVAFEKAAGKNIETLSALLPKLVDSGVPWLNTPIRLLDEKLVGNEYLPAIRAAKSIATREVARVVNDPGLKGQLTDDARHGVEQLLGDNLTIAQLKNVIPVLTNDMRNVHASLAEQKTAIEQRIATPPGGLAPVPAGRVRIVNIDDPTQSGTILATDAVPAGWRKQ